MTTPIACDMSGAPDTLDERLAEYRRLFDSALVSRERTDAGARWRLRSDPGIEVWARDLAAREEACCAFLTHTITRVGDEVRWDVTTVDDPAARAVLDLLHDLADAGGAPAGRRS